MAIVCIAGKFDPIHDGHVEHIIEAAKLGDFLTIITHTDEGVAKESKKGFCAVSLRSRKLLLEGLLIILGIKGEVIVAEPLDIDGGVSNTLRWVKPDIFAKGGDRSPSQVPIPGNEVEVCKELGIKIVYGVGRKLNESTIIMQQIIRSYDVLKR